jgi:hypothetical protein
MIFNLPIPILCILSIFYGYGAFALITGRAWNRWTGKIVIGAPARLGGITLIGMGALFTLLIYYPEREGEISATLCLWVINLMFLGWMIRQRQEPVNRLPGIPLEREIKGKRKNDELD